MVYRWFFFILTFTVTLHGEQIEKLSYGILAKRSDSLNHETVQQIQIFGERCSGTNYLSALIKENLSIPLHFHFGWKHFPCWYDTPFAEKHLSDLGEDYCTLSNSDSYLFLVIFRDPYDWLRSFYLNPFHVSHKVCRHNFTRFLRSTWFSDPEDRAVCGPAGIYDQSPSGGYFQNVLQLRSTRIANMLKIAEKANNVYFVNYERLRDHPREVLEEICAIFQLELREEFIPITSYKGLNQRTYNERKYFAFKRRDLLFINQHLDWSVEQKIGYQQKLFRRR